PWRRGTRSGRSSERRAHGSTRADGSQTLTRTGSSGRSLEPGSLACAAVEQTAGRGAHTWVILPTYNEAGNLEKIVAAVLAHLPDSRRVLIVDDNSPDGTGEIADQLAAEDDDLTVLHREAKEGLGPAYIAGFRQALAAGAEVIVEMDADFSHDPVDLPQLLAAVDDGADLAIGSRFVPGGGLTEVGLMGRGNTP